MMFKHLPESHQPKVLAKLT